MNPNLIMEFQLYNIVIKLQFQYNIEIEPRLHKNISLIARYDTRISKLVIKGIFKNELRDFISKIISVSKRSKPSRKENGIKYLVIIKTHESLLKPRNMNAYHKVVFWSPKYW